MTCDLRAFACLVASGCTLAQSDEPVLVEVETYASVPVRLIAPGREGVSYRWEIVTAAPDSVAEAPAQTAITEFTPDRRGSYQLERSTVIGAAHDVTHLFVVSAKPVAPVAVIFPERPMARVGDIVTLDASESYSPEGWPLTYQWSIRFRPGSGPLASGVGKTFMFSADASGSWGVSLTVSDGGLTHTLQTTVSVSSM